jgi:hypothetical protein
MLVTYDGILLSSVVTLTRAVLRITEMFKSNSKVHVMIIIKIIK